MNTDFINLTNENLTDEHLCCIIRSKKSHPGIDAKRQWLSERLSEGHIFRKLNAKATVFIEYAPLETAWVPVIGDNYYYLYCLWVLGSSKGKGYGKAGGAHHHHRLRRAPGRRRHPHRLRHLFHQLRGQRADALANHLQRNLVLKWLTLPIMDMNCLLFLSTEQYRNLRQMPRI